MKQVLVVSNFNAGRKKAIFYKKKLQKFLIKNVENFKFISIEELENIDVREFDTIIAMGGDGTINKTLPYVIQNNLTLGIIPTGTANLLAENLKIPSNIDKAIKVLEQGSETLIDIIKINDKYSSLRFGTGYDADIISKTPQSLKNKFGYFAYFIAGILFALRLKLKEFELESDNKKLTVKASCIIVANAVNMYKNWFRIGEMAALNDGLFDVFILKTQNPIIFFFELIKIALNIHKNSTSANYFRANNLKLRTLKSSSPPPACLAHASQPVATLSHTPLKRLAHVPYCESFSDKLLHAHIDGEKTTLKTDITFRIEQNLIKLKI